MKQICWTTRFLLPLLITIGQPVIAQDAADQKDKTETEQITEAQSRLAERYKLLEDKLFTLYEYERDTNPLRSKILKRAFLQSQEKMTALQLRAIVQLLNDANLKDAQARQNLVLDELRSLLELLESEDRGKRVRDELKRHQEYLKEIDRLLRMQRGIRGQTEGDAAQKRLANSQQKAADRTGKLADEIKNNEESPDPENAQVDSDDEPSDSDEAVPKDKKDGTDESSDSESNESKPNESKPGENLEGNRDSKSGDSKSEPKDGPAQPSQNQGNPGEGSQNSDGSPPQPQQQQANPVRKRVEAAQDRMRKAQQNLEDANRKKSVENMIAAEAELAAARKELEEILRQLREEEVERMLAMLESRFRQMLEREIRVYDRTRKLDGIAQKERNTNFEIRAGKISVEQNSIATEASRTLLLLREDGSSVAFPETVEQLHLDMVQVAQRLSAAKTGKITIEIEEDIIETLEYLIQALVVAQQDLEKMKQQTPGQQQAGKPGDKPLVDALAEIKMLRGLQERIYRRHKRYSNLLANPDDQIGSTDDPDLQHALERLSVRQQHLTDIARDIVVGKNQ